MDAASTYTSNSFRADSLSCCDRTFGNFATEIALLPGASARRPGKARRSGDRDRSASTGLTGKAERNRDAEEGDELEDTAAAEGLAFAVALGRCAQETRGTPDQPNMPEGAAERKVEACNKMSFVEPTGHGEKLKDLSCSLKLCQSP